MSGFKNTGDGSRIVAWWAGPDSCSNIATFCRPARIVHGNKVKAELLPWHFNANMLTTTLRFTVELTISDFREAAFAESLQDSQVLLAFESQQAGVLELFVVRLDSVLHVSDLQQAFWGSQHLEVARAVFSPTRTLTDFLAEAVSCFVGF